MNPKSCRKPMLLSTIAMSSVRNISALLLLTGSLHSQALPEDSQQPINIQSDRASQKVLSEGEKTEYFGSVLMTQGSLKISGEHIVIMSKDRKVQSIVATGKPVLFEQQSDPNKAPMKAEADNLNYRLKNETIILTENAKLDQAGNIVSGKRIEYNIASEQVKASSDDSTRVKMILLPEKKTDETNDKMGNS